MYPRSLGNHKLAIGVVVNDNRGAANGKIDSQRLLGKLGNIQELSNLKDVAVGDVVGVDGLDLVLVAGLGLEGGSWDAGGAVGGAGESNKEVSYFVRD